MDGGKEFVTVCMQQAWWEQAKPILTRYCRNKFRSAGDLQFRPDQLLLPHVFYALLLLYFLLMVLAAAILVLPGVRGRVFAGACKVADGLMGSSRRVLHRSGQGLDSAGRGVKRSVWEMAGYVLRHRLFWMGGIAAVVIPLSLGWMFGRHNLAFYDDAWRNPNAQVATLLHGEQLVPPPTLPPEIFETAEVALVTPLVREASRNWDSLDEEFRTRLLMVYKIMREKHGYELALLEGYRSPERQARLASLGDHVTRAGAGQSYHQYGLAADNAFYRNGKIVISEKDPWAMEGYRLYGEVAESMGLTWGGRWSFKDYGHVEFRKPGFKLPR